MPSYIVTRKSNGAEVYRYEAPAPIEWVGMEFTTHNHSEAVAGGAPSAPIAIYGGRRILSKLEFVELFTSAERVAIRAARGQSSALDDYLYMLEMAEEVNLDSPNVIGGLAMLEQAQILAAGRAQEILNG